MQLVSLTVNLGGSLTNSVQKVNATPAEILVLQALHGDDAVVDIIPTGEEPRRSDEEFTRLANFYDRASTLASAPGDENQPLMHKLFPGALKKLPETLDEIGLGHLNPEPAPAEKPKRRRAEKVEADAGENDPVVTVEDAVVTVEDGTEPAAPAVDETPAS